MKTYVLLGSLLLALGCAHVHGAPVEQAGLEQGSCEDASAKAAAELALGKINHDRSEGYVFGLHRLANVHMKPHGEIGMVFYLTLDVVETNCSVLSRKAWKDCKIRDTADTPVYGQCKAAIYISKPHRVVRLYKYSCTIRPVPAARVQAICPDCPARMDKDSAQVQKAATLSMDKFNKESGLAKRFAVLNVTRATASMGMGMIYNVEYTIQETTCSSTDAAAADKCPFMECEFSHKGFCEGSLFSTPDGEEVSVECEIYEPEAAEREKKFHLLGGETDHSHNDTHAPGQDQAQSHDHVHDHTKSHAHHDRTHKHAEGSDHHHTHDHGSGSGVRHGHAHSHDHGHGHDHVHAHHAKAHDHSGDFPNQHHDYKHADGADTHEHDHELALDHDHKHGHLHEHEHHHHHHDHSHEGEVHNDPEGKVITLPPLGGPMTLPSFPDEPVGPIGVTLPVKPDPQIPGEMEPTVEAFPTALSAQCLPPLLGESMVEKMFAEDPMFKLAA